MNAVNTMDKSCFAGKAKCKAALQKELGFNVDPKVPLLGWIGRLDFQKGPDVVLQAVAPMAQRGCQVGPQLHHCTHCSSQHTLLLTAPTAPILGPSPLLAPKSY